MSRASGPTRVAFCITDLDPGGAERALVRLVTGLDRQRWEPDVYCLAGPGALVKVLEQAGVPVTCLGARGVHHWGVIRRLSIKLRKNRPALLQTFLFHANIVGRIAGRRAGVKHIVSGIRVAEKRTRVHLWLDRYTNWLVDQNVCVSQAVADFSIRHARLHPRKIVVIPNGVDSERFSASRSADLTEFGISPTDHLFIFVGRLDPQKGLQFLVEAVRLAQVRHPRLKLLVVGEGHQRTAIQNWIQDYKLESTIHLTGWRADVPELLQASDCLVLPSLWEGMPNVALEAMAAGLPVIATQVEGVAELVQNEHTGLIIAPGSATELASAMSRILDAPQAARMMGKMGRQRALGEFSWQRMIDKYDELYRNLVGFEGP